MAFQLTGQFKTHKKLKGEVQGLHPFFMFIKSILDMNDCGCNKKNYNFSMGCCQPVVAPADNYYTKYQVDQMLEEIESAITSGCCITPEEVDEKIEEAISGITPCDLSEYWTSAQTESAITSAITVVEGEIPSLSGYATEQWVLDKHYISGVDLSDYALKTEIPTSNSALTNDAGYLTHDDLSDYYTKIEVDNKIASAETFDPTQYYTKSESDTRFALKSEIPSLSGYATTEWVTNQNFVTNTTIQQYITNLQQQINSIVETVSGCCSQTGQTEYRWITMTGDNDYACSGTTKMTKEKEQSSTDGLNWVDTGNYRTGSTVLEINSSDCGYVPTPQYRWKAAPTSDYLCSGTSKYYKVYYEVSTDGGQTWQHVVPEQTKRGDLIQANSPDCGYVAPQYRWKAAPTSDYLCSGTSKYYKVYYEVSYDSGSTWQHVVPEQTKRGNLIETNSTDCGYVAPQYRWYTSQSEYICSGTTKYQKQYYQVSYNGGSTWQNVSPEQTRMGSVIEYNSSACGVTCNNPIARVTNAGSDTWYNICDISGNSAVTRADVVGSLTTQQLNNINVLQILESCTKVDDNAFKGTTTLTMIGNLGLNVTTIGKSAFSGCTNLSEVVYVGCHVTKIDNYAFKDCTHMTGISICNNTPPTLGTSALDNTNNCPIYVPASAVNTYKAASGWSNYASRIQAIQ